MDEWALAAEDAGLAVDGADALVCEPAVAVGEAEAVVMADAEAALAVGEEG